jgi:hypothetical protein
MNDDITSFALTIEISLCLDVLSSRVRASYYARLHMHETDTESQLNH